VMSWGSCKLLTFRGEPFEVHSCLTYALASRMLERINGVVADRLEKGLNEMHSGCFRREHAELAVRVFGVLVLFHDVGKLLPIYPRNPEEYKGFHLHEVFSFLILRQAVEGVLRDALNQGLNNLDSCKYYEDYAESYLNGLLLPVLLHHSAHRWILEGRISGDVEKLAEDLCRRYRKEADPCLDGVSAVMERSCLCVLDDLRSLCLRVAENISNALRDIAGSCWSLQSEVKDELKNMRRLFQSSATQILVTLLTPVLQVSDRIAAKIVRGGSLSQLDQEALRHLMQ